MFESASKPHSFGMERFVFALGRRQASCHDTVERAIDGTRCPSLCLAVLNEQRSGVTSRATYWVRELDVDHCRRKVRGVSAVVLEHARRRCPKMLIVSVGLGGASLLYVYDAVGRVMRTSGACREPCCLARHAEVGSTAARLPGGATHARRPTSRLDPYPSLYGGGHQREDRPQQHACRRAPRLTPPSSLLTEE